MARRHPHGIPPVKCHAKAKSTGEPCRQFAVVGGTVCYHHGANGRVMNAAERRVTLAQLVERDPRNPMEIVLDMTHKLDVITEAYQDELLANVEDITDDQVDRLIQLSSTTHHLASTAINTKAHEKIALAFDRHVDVLSQMVNTAIDAALDKVGLSEPWRSYAFVVGHRALLIATGDDPGPEPQPPEEPVVAEHDTRPRDTARAIEAGTAAAVSPCDVAAMADDQLQALGEAVLDELERRGVDG
jgi:hypothetical protein